MRLGVAVLFWAIWKTVTAVEVTILTDVKMDFAACNKSVDTDVIQYVPKVYQHALCTTYKCNGDVTASVKGCNIWSGKVHYQLDSTLSLTCLPFNIGTFLQFLVILTCIKCTVPHSFSLANTRSSNLQTRIRSCTEPYFNFDTQTYRTITNSWPQGLLGVKINVTCPNDAQCMNTPTLCEPQAGADTDAGEDTWKIIAGILGGLAALFLIIAAAVALKKKKKSSSQIYSETSLTANNINVFLAPFPDKSFDNVRPPVGYLGNHTYRP